MNSDVYLTDVRKIRREDDTNINKKLNKKHRTLQKLRWRGVRGNGPHKEANEKTPNRFERY